MKFTFTGIFICLFFSNFGQKHQWWVDEHNWDGITSWHRYLNIAPETMGPSALPVPDAEVGLVVSEFKLEVSGESHISTGDFTNNIFTSFNAPLFSDRVSLRMHMVPVEYYVNDVKTRNERASRDEDGRGTSVGDLYIGTNIQLVKDADKWPDVLLSLNLKTASGDNMRAARFTDAPGYSFNLSAGKDLTLGKTTKIRPFGRVGFLCYQTNLLTYFQNDAVLYGLGARINHKSFQFQTSADGYAGYIGNGDCPFVLRASVAYNAVNGKNYFIRFQQGLNDFQYSSFRVGCVFTLGKNNLSPLFSTEMEPLEGSAGTKVN